MELIAELGGLEEVGAKAIVAFGIILILTGRLVPKMRLDEARLDRDAWRVAYTVEHDARLVAEADQGQRSRTQDLMMRLLSALTPPGQSGEEVASDGSSQASTSVPTA